MKLTEDELTYLQKLSDTEVGSFLVHYAKRVQDFVYDSREWKEGDTLESAKKAASVIQDHFINRLLPRSMKDKGVSMGEDGFE